MEICSSFISSKQSKPKYKADMLLGNKKQSGKWAFTITSPGIIAYTLKRVRVKSSPRFTYSDRNGMFKQGKCWQARCPEEYLLLTVARTNFRETHSYRCCILSEKRGTSFISTKPHVLADKVAIRSVWSLQSTPAPHTRNCITQDNLSLICLAAAHSIHRTGTHRGLWIGND